MLCYIYTVLKIQYKKLCLINNFYVDYMFKWCYFGYIELIRCY